MSVPDISLLVPLAEQLNVTVAELLQGRRVEEEQRFTREETEELIRKALTFSAEPPERRQARTQKFLPLYGVSVVLGLVETAAVWAVGLAGTEGAMMLLIINVIFGIVYGAYTLFWMPETLPRYYDENHVCNFAQGASHMHIPGVYYNNRNWLHVIKAMRVWCVVSMLLTPLCTAAAAVLEQAPDGRCGVQCLSDTLHRCLAQSSSRQRSINDRIAQGERKRSLLLLTAMWYNKNQYHSGRRKIIHA